MRTIQLNVPDNLDLNDYDFSMIVAVKLYEEAKLSATHITIYKIIFVP